jgi:hypothetical protein
MTDQSGFQAHFEFVLQAYERMTGITLAQHPLVVQLESCLSVGDITAFLQRQAEPISDPQARDKIMKSIKTVVSILTSLYDAASLAHVVSLVRQKLLMSCFTFLPLLCRLSHLRKQYRLVSPSYLMYVPSPVNM